MIAATQYIQRYHQNFAHVVKRKRMVLKQEIGSVERVSAQCYKPNSGLNRMHRYFMRKFSVLETLDTKLICPRPSKVKGHGANR